MNNDLANTIRSKVDIVDIIGERIPLIARGKNFFGVCPFHDGYLRVGREINRAAAASSDAAGRNTLEKPLYSGVLSVRRIPELITPFLLDGCFAGGNRREAASVLLLIHKINSLYYCISS